VASELAPEYEQLLPFDLGGEVSVDPKVLTGADRKREIEKPVV
jgi:hypothetical protein